MKLYVEITDKEYQTLKMINGTIPLDLETLKGILRANFEEKEENLHSIGAAYLSEDIKRNTYTNSAKGIEITVVEKRRTF